MVVDCWLWIAIESETKKNILAISLSRERNMFVAEHFLSDIVDKYGQYPVSTDMMVHGIRHKHKFLKLKHHLHSSWEKSIIERTIQYIKDRTKCFDDYFPCRKKKCKLKHVRQWLIIFVDHYNKEIIP